MIERTLALIKPDGIERGLIGEIIKRFENVGLKIVGMKMLWIDKNFAKRFYTDDITKRRGAKVRENLIRYITIGPVIAICLEGIHAVGNEKEAKEEIKLWFSANELHDYKTVFEKHVY